ncbi:MAG: glutamate racemase [bacterium]|nr:glutamate racemase [bacterium]
MSDPRPIGIFDSGLGGLTVTRAIRERLAQEEIIYYGDTARVPYGSKSRDTIIRFTREALRFLREHEVKCVVIACNTASALALDAVREEVGVPLLGVIEPGARAAVATTRARKIGVIGTTATIASDVYAQAIHRLDPHITVYSQPCPLLVPLVEEGWTDREATRLIVAEYLQPLRTARIDTLVLGCTHYPLLAGVLQEYMGPEVALVDSAQTCAAELEELLTARGLRAPGGPGEETFFVTDMAARFAELGARFLGRRLQAIKVVGHE